MTRLTLQPGEAASHASSTSATSIVAFAADVQDSVSDQVCVTSTFTLAVPTSSPAKLAAI